MEYIKRHDYKLDYIFRKIDNEDDLYMGVELEVDMGGESEENAKGVLDILNCNRESNAYCMHDGSLNGGSNTYSMYSNSTTGFEIATMPCTLDYHKTLPYEEALKFLVNKGYKSHDTKTCGMHVHVNRTFFGADKLTQDLNISKLMFLFEKYWNDVVVIARRDSNFYARRSFLENDESVIDLYSKSKSKGKYAAINLEHKNSIEIRIFRGTLNYDTYMCTLEFVYKICKLVKEVDIYDIQMIKWTDIENTFSKELKKYIDTRREIEKNKEKVPQQEISDRRYGYQRGLPSIYGTSSLLSIRGLAYNQITVEAISQMLVGAISEQNLLSSNDLSEYHREELTKEIIKKKIKKIRKQINMARNELERLNLRRKLTKLEKELAQAIRLDRR